MGIITPRAKTRQNYTLKKKVEKSKNGKGKEASRDRITADALNIKYRHGVGLSLVNGNQIWVVSPGNRFLSKRRRLAFIGTVDKTGTFHLLSEMRQVTEFEGRSLPVYVWIARYSISSSEVEGDKNKVKALLGFCRSYSLWLLKQGKLK